MASERESTSANTTLDEAVLRTVGVHIRLHGLGVVAKSPFGVHDPIGPNEVLP